MIILLYPAACIYSSILFSFFKFKKKEKKKRKRIRRNTFSHIENSKNERFHSILEKKKKKNRSPDINERNQKYSSVKWPRNIPFVPPIGNNFHPSILKAREMWKALPRICQSHDKLLVDIIATRIVSNKGIQIFTQLVASEWKKKKKKKINARKRVAELTEMVYV